ncbi:N-acetyl-gamma-glutamyl-phosphate reductase [Intestinibacillus sp. Marseille-P6563]|uniref:N-acetyl-gamma-glutamyl-phosphate reductase n=1 Tax=Intestinibacillus sp. Marseille-P6563 TaxID=2364792 RepID=UPI0019CF95DF|nr:N-acetyl-gamma-glutamyl-phosphate reductase [Intestinibacillus sp. Marseille-P6563]
MKPKIYIDGKEGTTGLQIYERLGSRDDIELLLIDEDKRKDTEERKKFLNAADIVFLCLPDAAAREAVTLIENDRTRVIDASTAHRTAEGWDYGFAELSAERRAAIAQSKRVANPGCHATGLIASVYPLIQMGLMPADYPLTVFSLTGYSGGGKKMIAEYEGEGRDTKLDSPRIYGLNLHHKHLPEMQKVCGLTYPPVFCPVVDDYYKGMAGTIQLHNALLTGHPSAQDICDKLAAYYEGQKLVTVAPFGGEDPMIAANTLAGKDSLQLIVCGHEEQTIVTALFDNLGKGASGAAVQNMNIMLGLDETTGLSL